LAHEIRGDIVGDGLSGRQSTMPKGRPVIHVNDVDFPGGIHDAISPIHFERSIEKVIVQRHVEGRVFKFYGVGEIFFSLSFGYFLCG